MDASVQERLSSLIRKLRGERSQRNFAKTLGLSYAAVFTYDSIPTKTPESLEYKASGIIIVKKYSLFHYAKI